MRSEKTQNSLFSSKISITSHTLIFFTWRKPYWDRLTSYQTRVFQGIYSPDKRSPPMVWLLTELQESHLLRDLTLLKTFILPPWQERRFNRKSLTWNTNCRWSRTYGPPWSRKTKTNASWTWMLTSKSWQGNIRNSLPLSYPLKSIWKMYWISRSNWIPNRKIL